MKKKKRINSILLDKMPLLNNSGKLDTEGSFWTFQSQYTSIACIRISVVLYQPTSYPVWYYRQNRRNNLIYLLKEEEFQNVTEILWQLLPLPQWQGSSCHCSSSELHWNSPGLQLPSAAGAVGVLEVGLRCLAPVASHLLPEQFVFIPSALHLVLLSCSFQSEWSSCLEPQNMTEFRIPADTCTPWSLENST